MFVAAAACAAAALSTACGAGPTQLADELAVNMGDASPVASPPSLDRSQLAGEVWEFEAVRDLDATDGLIAARTESALHVGTLEEFKAGKAKAYPLDAACGDASGNAGTFAVGCGDSIRLFTAQGEETIATDAPVTAATVTTTGEVLAGSDAERTVWLYKDGELAKTFSVARETDQIQAVPVEGQPDTVVRTNSFDTTIQDMDWQGGRQGGTLRVGLGVGKVTGGENGLVLAADATGSQLLVYTTDDIIRLQQMAPVPESPWDAAWDPAERLAWVASTAGNVATGYDISRGVPLERASIATVADPQSIISLDDGTLLIASATGDGLQVVRPTDKQLRDLPEGK
ncbi:hypothetical protein JZY91_05445 [Corynebacterium sp. CNCTC7651]|nr:hypothetical protein JZY91_05445 [Corynebacterium sp. CNCTC7651]